MTDSHDTTGQSPVAAAQDGDRLAESVRVKATRTARASEGKDHLENP